MPTIKLWSGTECQPLAWPSFDHRATLQTSFKYFVSFQLGQTINIFGSSEHPLLDVKEGSSQRGCKDDNLPKIQRITPKDSRKEKMTMVMSKAGRKPSQVLRTQNETSKKARAIPAVEGGGSITSLIWKGSDETIQEILFSLLTGDLCRQRSRRADSGKDPHP